MQLASSPALVVLALLVVTGLIALVVAGLAGLVVRPELSLPGPELSLGPELSSPSWEAEASESRSSSPRSRSGCRR